MLELFFAIEIRTGFKLRYKLHAVYVSAIFNALSHKILFAIISHMDQLLKIPTEAIHYQIKTSEGGLIYSQRDT